MLKIRLMRIGAKKRPFYRVVVVDERNKRNSSYIELIGTYNPLTEPKEIKLKQDRIEHWIKQGAKKSDGLLKILKEAPQKLPRKPKKTQPATATVASDKKEEIKMDDVPTQEPKVEETQVEQISPEEKPVEEETKESDKKE